MAYNQALAARVRRILAEHSEVSEKKMFGGLTFLCGGRMCCGIVKDDLMVRVGPERHAQALSAPGARPMDFTGKPMKGFVFVGPEGITGEEALRGWIEDALAFAREQG